VLESKGIPHVFELMVIDVEGAEEPIVSALLETAWRPKVLIIELCDIHPDFQDKPLLTASHGRVRAMLTASGYQESHVDPINTIFKWGSSH
jgi:hypothetical protein